MSKRFPTNGVMNLAFPECSIHLTDRISSRMSSEEPNIFLRPVDFHTCLTYELIIILANRMSNLPVLPSSNQLPWGCILGCFSSVDSISLVRILKREPLGLSSLTMNVVLHYSWCTILSIYQGLPACWLSIETCET